MNELLKSHKTICNHLKTKTAEEVAVMFNVTKKEMQKFIETNEISITKIRKEHAEKLISKMHKKYTISEMVKKSGFSRTKVNTLIKKLGVLSKFSNKIDSGEK